jgi:hypothetical protein
LKENGHRKWQSFLHLGLEMLWSLGGSYKCQSANSIKELKQ